MFRPIFRLLLFRGSPTDVNGSLPAIGTFAFLVLAFAWLTLPTERSTNLSPEEILSLRTVLLVIPIITYALVALMIFAILNIRKFNDRFSKTISACFGLLLLYQVGIYFFSLFLPWFFGSISPFINGAVQFAMFCWFIGAGGYVLLHAFSLKLYQGVLASIVLMFVASVISGIITSIVFPDAVGTFAEIQNQLYEMGSSD